MAESSGPGGSSHPKSWVKEKVQSESDQTESNKFTIRLCWEGKRTPSMVLKDLQFDPGSELDKALDAWERE